MQNPQISVIMPVKDGEKYIGQAIDSILNQSFTDFELIIINDASADRTLDVISGFKDKRIIIINNIKSEGLSLTRNKGINISKGKYIAFLDSDDISLPDRLKTQIEYLEKYPDISLAGSWIEVIDSNGNRSGKIWKHALSPEIIPSILLFRSCFTQSAVMVNRKCLEKFSFRDNYSNAPDYDLWVKLSEKYKLANIGKILTFYRMHDSNMSLDKVNLIRECTRRVMKNHLSRLGLNASSENLDTHQLLEPGKCNYSASELDNIEKWLLKLCAYNNNRRIFNISIFNNLLSDYWFKICIANGNKGFSVWRRYNKSALSCYGRFNLKKFFLLFFCILGKARNIDITSEVWLNPFSILK